MSNQVLVGASEVVAALATLRAEVAPGLAGVVKETTIEARSRARALAPVRTGTLVDAIWEKFFDDGTTGVVFVAPRQDPNSRRSRQRPAQFPLWVEYGTTKWRGKPFLLPSFRGMVGQFDRRVREAMARLVERAE